jgi:hypothetical protein
LRPIGVNLSHYALTNQDLDLDLDLDFDEDIDRMFSFRAHIRQHAAGGKRDLVQVQAEVQVQVQVCEE